MRKYTAIIYTINGKELKTIHFETKSEMLKTVSEYITDGYQVKVMKWSVWYAREM